MQPATNNLLFSFSQNIDPKYEERDGPEKGELRFEVKGDEYLDLGYAGQGAGDGWRMIGPQGNRSKWEAPATHQREGLWTPPPDRESKLDVVKLGSLYSIRAYKGETKPSRLYDGDEEQRYKIAPEEVSPETSKELEDERQEIIKSQVVRKSTTMAERWNSMDELEAINAATPGKGAAPRSYSTGFAICFDNPSPSWVSRPVDPENIDTEQINFAAARQQFLDLENANPGGLLGAKKRTVSPRGMQVTMEALERGYRSPGTAKLEEGVSGGCDQQGSGSNQRSEFLTPQGRGASKDGVAVEQNPYGDYLGSNVGETPHDMSSVTPDGKASRTTFEDRLDAAAVGHAPAKEEEARRETPIEREIRLTLEREQDFWKERGVRRVNSRDELVEIQAKPFLLSPVSSPASSRKGKEKPRASFYVQRDIEQETKREETLQEERRQLGTHGSRSQQQPADCWKGFEHWGEIPFKPLKFTERRQPLDGESVPVDAEGLGRQNMNGGTQACRPSPAPDAGIRRPGDGVPSLSQSFATGDQQMDPPSLRLPDPQEKRPGEEFVLRKEHFAVPIRKIRFSASKDQGLLSTQRREQKAEWRAPRQELYTLKTWRHRTSALIDQEIQEHLQRELELQEQRRKDRLILETTPSSRTSSQSSAASGVSGSYSVSTSPTFASDSFPDRDSPEKSECNLRTCQSPGMRQREGGKYAGIEPSDEIDNEVVNATKAICRRGLRAQLWETGQIHKTDDDTD